ncbi:pectate lyase [Gracilibacillus alcaliphilus]|uniref:pectate lyase n=1 Tax=Gracilibacillus alcaliphilus TaxID=1401441 RepID=UPI001959EDC1|nr:pectate lyase [Gracilibacillus alcaliphilus]MBM7677802.1 PelA/Pel-15E family pectate lyase [Gracilibacillus alcaliphilus]
MNRWKRSCNIFLILLLISTTICSVLPVQAIKAAPAFNNVVIFQDTFEEETVGEPPANLDIMANGGTVTVGEAEGNQFVMLEDTSEEEAVQISKSFEEVTDQVTIELSVMQPNYKSSAKILRVKGNGTAAIIETKDGYISYRHGDDTYQELVELEEGVWYAVKLEINLTEQTVNTYINDQLILEETALYQAVSSIDSIESITPGNGAYGHLIDDVVISHVQTVEEEEVDVEEKPEGEVIFEHNFNEDTIGEAPSDVTVSNSGGTVTVADVPSEENKSVYLDDTSEETNVIMSKNLPDLAGKVTMELKFMQPSYTNSTKVVRIKGDGTPVIIETKDDHITYRTGDHYEPLIEVIENEWYDIKIEMNLDHQIANVYINDELQLAQAAFNQATTHINFFETFTPNGGTKGHYMDDIRVTELKPGESVEPEPNPEEPTEPEEPSKPEEPAEHQNSQIYEAEEAELHAAIVDNKHTGYTGSGFVDYSPNAPGGWIEWTIDVPVDGEYYLDFRYAHGGTDQRPTEIAVDGEIIAPELAFDPTGGFADWEYTSTKATLTAGEHKVRATGIAPSGGANIDHLRVWMEIDDIYEAEEADFDEQMVIIDNQHAGYTGSGFIDFEPNQPGSWVDWTIDVPVAGEYTLAFRYAHGGTDQRPAEIKIDGQVAAASLAFDPTGAWTNWEYTSITVSLEAGEHIVRATGIGASGGANIDHLRVYNGSEAEREDSVEVEDSSLEEVVGEPLVKKMEQLGLTVTEQAPDEQEITRLEFFALVNDAFGFPAEEKFKQLHHQEFIWEVSAEKWYAYVLETAKREGYADDLVTNGNILPHQVITKQEATYILASLMEKEVSSEQTPVTWGEAREWLPPQVEREVEILGVHALSNQVMAVTLNGYFIDFDYNDLEAVVPTRAWELLTPNFRSLQVDKATHSINQFGQTVVLFHSLEAWDEYGEYPQEVEENRFAGDLEYAIQEADNLLTWQMEHGGWTKNWSHIYTRPWDGEESRSEWVNNGVELGTIDNDATISEILYLAQVYQETKDDKYKESIEKGMEFLFQLQYDTGGFAQVYPARGNYSDYVTFNDEAMINVLETLDLVAEQRYPFNGDLISEEYVTKTKESIELAIDYILNAQIEVDGKLTAWCAQHDPVTYEPKEARAYEHPSISGQESIGIIRYLMSRPQTEEINRAVLGALEWLDDVKLENTRYISGDPNNQYFVEDNHSTAWYRFYQIGSNKPIFSGRDGVIKHNIMEIEEERRNGYSWGGHWGVQLLQIAQATGNYTDKVYVQVKNTDSADSYGRRLKAEHIGMLKALDIHGETPIEENPDDDQGPNNDKEDDQGPNNEEKEDDSDSGDDKDQDADDDRQDGDKEGDQHSGDDQNGRETEDDQNSDDDQSREYTEGDRDLDDSIDGGNKQADQDTEADKDAGDSKGKQENAGHSIDQEDRAAKDSESGQTATLPDTATAIFNYIAISIVLLLLGSMMILMDRSKKRE